MKFLVFGAGVLGCNLANNLFRAGKDVTLLARGAWVEEIRSNGLRIKNSLSRRTAVSPVPVAAELSPEDAYDVIFVAVRYTQIETILETLRASRAKSGCDKWHDYEMSVAPYETDKPIYYEFTACPAAEFAIRHGLTDIMPALCNVDLASMELIHARLIRKTTCANGCKCDYTICGDQDPYVKEHPEYRDEAGFRRNR